MMPYETPQPEHSGNFNNVVIARNHEPAAIRKIYELASEMYESDQSDPDIDWIPRRLATDRREQRHARQSMLQEIRSLSQSAVECLVSKSPFPYVRDFARKLIDLRQKNGYSSSLPQPALQASADSSTHSPTSTSIAASPRPSTPHIATAAKSTDFSQRVRSVSQRLTHFNQMVLQADRVPTEMLKEWTSEVVWWWNHSSGPVLAPGFSENLQQGPEGCFLRFGANEFYVESAIRRCVEWLESLLAGLDKRGHGAIAANVRQNLIDIISQSVTSFNVPLFREGYRVVDGRMHFGVHAIDAAALASLIWDQFKVSEICR